MECFSNALLTLLTPTQKEDELVKYRYTKFILTFLPQLTTPTNLLFRSPSMLWLLFVPNPVPLLTPHPNFPSQSLSFCVSYPIIHPACTVPCSFVSLSMSLCIFCLSLSTSRFGSRSSLCSLSLSLCVLLLLLLHRTSPPSRFVPLPMKYHSAYLWMLSRAHTTVPTMAAASAPMLASASAIRRSATSPSPRWAPRTSVPNWKGELIAN